MKVKIFLFFLISQIAFLFPTNGQVSDFNSELKKLSDQIILKIKNHNKNKIAVWDFTDLNGKIMVIGRYISEQVSVNFSNSNTPFLLMDRNHLETILREHKLNAEGFIDQKTAKELGKFVAVDAIVTGKITVLSDHINLTMKVLETETAMNIASVSGNIPMDENIRELLGIPTKNSRSGFNGIPIDSDEEYDNPEVVDKKCQENETGQVCFNNLTGNEISVYLSEEGNECILMGLPSIIVNTNQKKCFNNVKAKSFYYFVFDRTHPRCSPLSKAQVSVEVCRVKSITIR